MVNNNEVKLKGTAFLENNPDYPGATSNNNDVTTSSSPSSGSGPTSLDNGDFVSGNSRLNQDPPRDGEAPANDVEHMNTSDDNTDLVIDEGGNQQAPAATTASDSVPNYITIQPDQNTTPPTSHYGGPFYPGMGPTSAYSLLNSSIFSHEALKKPVFPGASEKPSALKDNLLSSSMSSVNKMAAPRRCAPVREAVDPAKYITVQEGDGVKYACSKCGNIYKWRKSLNKHWKEKHDGEIPEPRSGANVALPRLTRGSPYAGAVSAARQQRSPASAPAAATAPYSVSLPLNHHHAYRNSLLATSYQNMAAANPFDAMRPGSLKAPATPPSSRSIASHSASSIKREYSNDILENIRQQQKLVARFFPTPTTTKAALAHSPPRAHSSSSAHSYVMPRSSLDAPMDLTPDLTPNQDGVLDLSMKSSRKHSVTSIMASASPSMTSSTANNQDEPIDFSVKQDNGPKSSGFDVNSLWSMSKHRVTSSPQRPVAKLPTEDKPRPCSSCGYIAYDEQDLQAHRQLHAAETFTCAECQQTLASMTDLNKHFLCHMPVLAKRMTQMRNEQRASNGQEGNGGDQLYQYLSASKRITSCVVCGAVYQFQWALASHFDQKHSSLPNPYQIHSTPEGSPLPSVKSDVMDESEAMYSCSQCSFSAVTTSELARHQILHSLKKHRVCRVCGYTAKTTVELLEHYEEDHPDIQPADVTPATGNWHPVTCDVKCYICLLFHSALYCSTCANIHIVVLCIAVLSLKFSSIKSNAVQRCL